jgi:mannosyltransferase OCH1-like enzyme
MILKSKKIIPRKKNNPIYTSPKENIPKNIFQTWKTKQLHGNMKETVDMIHLLNPGYNHFIFDDNDCRQFIQTHFDVSVLNAYNTLIPGAYKADLWRYCILYILGGIYLDIKYKPVNGFSFDALIQKDHLVMDIHESGIYNAFMICYPKHPILLKCIKKVVENVQKKIYGTNPLDVTGPTMMARIVNKKDPIIDLTHSANPRIIKYNDTVILEEYDSYRSEQIGPLYQDLWYDKKIYL